MIFPTVCYHSVTFYTQVETWPLPSSTFQHSILTSECRNILGKVFRGLPGLGSLVHLQTDTVAGDNDSMIMRLGSHGQPRMVGAVGTWSDNVLKTTWKGNKLLSGGKVGILLAKQESGFWWGQTDIFLLFFFNWTTHKSPHWRRVWCLS